MAKSTAAEPALSKAGFIRQFPTDTPADDVVALGAEAGLTLTKKMVWTVQSELRHPKKASSKKASSKSSSKKNKTAKKAAAKKSAKKTAKKKKAASKPTATKAAEQRLKALILQVGLARAEAVYDQLREQLDALLD
jgi:uncharacterized membrane protein YgaE (UPF0421/DUF939 family)